MPVTHGVAGSSPVQTATFEKKAIQFRIAFFSKERNFQDDVFLKHLKRKLCCFRLVF